MMGLIADKILEATGYGTLGHLVEILIYDREIHGHDDDTEEGIVNKAIDQADELWDGIIGPMLDRLGDELT